MFALHKDGKIMYISETASVHLGLPQIDLTGSSIFEYIHPADHDEIYDSIKLSEKDKLLLDTKRLNNLNDTFEVGRTFCIRMKCILPKRNAGLVNSGYKAIHCNGYLKVRCVKLDNKQLSSTGRDFDWEGYAIIAVGHSLLPTASTEIKLTKSSFMFRASMDLKLFYAETR